MGHSTLLGTRPSAAWLLITCIGCGDAAADGDGVGAGGDGNCEPEPTTGSDPTTNPVQTEFQDELTPLRLLRRASLSLLGVAPPSDVLAQLAAIPTAPEQLAFVDRFVDEALKDPKFYDSMFELGSHWINLPLVDRTADEPEYGPKQQRVLMRCPDGSPQAGALHYYRDDRVSTAEACASSSSIDVEPWWAPGTMVRLVGSAANTTNQGMTNINGNQTPIECNGRPEGTCGCQDNAVACWFDPGTYPGWATYIPGNPRGQRRLLAEEPARLFAHLAWHDLPATDLILSDTSVGPTEVQAAYVSQSLAGGDLSLFNDDSWWQPSAAAGLRSDPHHDAQDPWAWREYSMSARNTFFLAERDYKFDPRKDAGPSRGFPSAGALTTIGFLATYPRERLRASRALEVFACEQLLPPGSGIEFNPYLTDPGREGPCQHCHVRIDTASPHFKRFAKAGSAFEGWGARYFIPGVASWTWDPVWRTGEYPYTSEPFAQWNKWYQPGTLMTPATPAEAEANPDVLFLDFLPPEYSMLGQVSDGTVGPLGFAKMVVAAGSFDRCVVRKIHEHVMGRDIDPTTEAGYLEAWVARFLESDRKIRPLVKALTQSASFRRGR